MKLFGGLAGAVVTTVDGFVAATSAALVTAAAYALSTVRLASAVATAA